MNRSDPIQPWMIRKALSRDAGQISALLDQLGYSVSPKAVRRRLDALQERTGNATWVAIAEDETVIGCLQAMLDLRLAEGVYVEITSLVVDSAYRGQGLGQRLVTVAEDWGRRKGGTQLRVRCNVKRERTHRFYRQLGYQVLKRQMVFEKCLSG